MLRRTTLELLFSVLTLALLPHFMATGTDGFYGFVEVSSGSQKVVECVAFESSLSEDMPTKPKDALPFSVALHNVTVSLCEKEHLVPIDGGLALGTVASAGVSLRDPFVIPSNCTITHQAVLAQRAGAGALLLVIDYPREMWSYVQPYVNKSVVTIPIYFIYRDNLNSVLNDFHASGDSPNRSHLPLASARFYQPGDYLLSPSLVVVTILALLPLIIGGYWSGVLRHQLYLACMEKRRQKVAEADINLSASRAGTTESLSVPPKKEAEDVKSATEKKSTVRVTAIAVAVLVGMMIGVLLLLYYAYSYFVWVVIVIFVIFSAWGIFEFIAFLYDKIPMAPHYKLSFSPHSVIKRLCCEHCTGGLSTDKVDMFHVIIYCFCAAFGICWAIYRNQWYAYILQDIMGLFFCVHMLKNCRLPNLKWITVILMVLLVYDAIFVFLTPYMTSTGCSIMVDVATGGACSNAKRFQPDRNGSAADTGQRWPFPYQEKEVEQIPILFRVPRSHGPVDRCQGRLDPIQPVMLGFGDIMMPGILIAYCAAFDLAWRVPYHLYFVTSLIAYLAGLIVTYVALELSDMPQPALIYLVPFTLASVHVLALLRKQWTHIWHGEVPDPVFNLTGASYGSESQEIQSESTLRPDELANLIRETGAIARSDPETIAGSKYAVKAVEDKIPNSANSAVAHNGISVKNAQE